MTNRVKSLFNTPGERHGIMRGLRHALRDRGAVALISGLYAVWLSACCSGPAALIAVPGVDTVLLELPPWMGPILAMAVASAVIAIQFKRHRREREGTTWLAGLASAMALSLAIHLAWALGLGATPLANGALYGLASVLSGASAAFFRVEIDRVFGWIGTQQTLLQGMLGTLVTMTVMALCVGIGGVGGRGFIVLCVVALVVPFILFRLLAKLIGGFPRTRYYGHGQDAPLPFPTKFVVTSAVQGMASGIMFVSLFLYRGEADPLSVDVVIGQVVGVVLLFATLLLFRLDFNRFIYKVAFSFLALGFLLVALGWGGVETGIVVLAAGFCYLDLVLWSLGACLIKNMGQPAPWVASCPGAALFGGTMIGGALGYLALGSRPLEEVTVLGSFVACFLFAMALYLSSGDNLKYGWGTVLPGESSLEADDLGGVVRFMATEQGITQRETEVMALLVEGKSRREICDELTVSPDTVKTHVRSVYRKIGVHSQQELIDRVVVERDRLMLDGGAGALREDRLK